MSIPDKEIQNVSNLDPFERYKYLIKRVADAQVMYTLKSGDGWAIAKVEDIEIFSIWSAREFSQLNAIDTWEGDEVVEIDLDAFENEIVPFLEENGYLLNVFSLNRKSGFVVEVDEFMRDLNEELSKYL